MVLFCLLVITSNPWYFLHYKCVTPVSASNLRITFFSVILCVSYQECVSLETKEEEKGMVPLTALSNDPLTNFEFLYYSAFTGKQKSLQLF
jgi:hypothetical protein